MLDIFFRVNFSLLNNFLDSIILWSFHRSSNRRKNIIIEIGSYHVVLSVLELVGQADLKFRDLPNKCWDQSHKPTHLTDLIILIYSSCLLLDILSRIAFLS